MTNSLIDMISARYPSTDGNALFRTSDDGAMSQPTDIFAQLEDALDSFSGSDSDLSSLLSGLSGSGTTADATDSASSQGTAGAHGHHGRHGRNHQASTTDGATTDTASTAQLSVSGDTIDTGGFTIVGSKSHDGSVTVTDKSTGKTTEVWGDPHITDEDGQQVADFQKNNLDLKLSDGTLLNIETTPENSDGKSHVGKVTVSKNGTTATINSTDPTVGLSSGVSTSGVIHTGRHGGAEALVTDDDNKLYLDSKGDLYTQTDDGTVQAVKADSNGKAIDLDATDHPTSGTCADGGSNDISSFQEEIEELEEQLEQLKLQNLYQRLFSSSSFGSSSSDSSGLGALLSGANNLWG